MAEPFEPTPQNIAARYEIDRFDRQGLRRCAKRVRELEAGIERFLEARADSEMSNVEAAIEHLEHLMEEV